MREEVVPALAALPREALADEPSNRLADADGADVGARLVLEEEHGAQVGPAVDEVGGQRPRRQGAGPSRHRRRRRIGLPTHNSARMVFESRPIERLREHVGPIIVGLDVFHLDFPLCNPFLQLEVAPLDVP
eukprot:scaffold25735_cov42-Phaeocystis_antarctica.AAC.4